MIRFPSPIERDIDHKRRDCQWESALKAIERLAHVCNVQELSDDGEITELQSFYYTSLAEVLLEYNKDFDEAINAIRKAQRYEKEFSVNWRIIFVRILLWGTETIFSPNSYRARGKKISPNFIFDISYLAQALKSFPISEQDIVLQSIPVDSQDESYCKALVVAMSCIPPNCIELCSHKMLDFFRDHPIGEVSSLNKIYKWVLSICTEILKNIKIDVLYDIGLNSEFLTEYSTLLYFDAILSKSILYELQGFYIFQPIIINLFWS